MTQKIMHHALSLLMKLIPWEDAGTPNRTVDDRQTLNTLLSEMDGF